MSFTIDSANTKFSFDLTVVSDVNVQELKFSFVHC